MRAQLSWWCDSCFFSSFFFSSSFLMMLYNVCWCVVRVCEWLREYESELGDSYISFLFLLDFFVTCFILIKLTIKLLLLSTWFVLLSLLWLDIKLVLVMYCASVFVSLSISSICSNLLFWIFLTLLFFSGFTSSSFSFCVFVFLFLRVCYMHIKPFEQWFIALILHCNSLWLGWPCGESSLVSVLL